MNYVKPERLWLKSHAERSEKRVQQRSSKSIVAEEALAPRSRSADFQSAVSRIFNPQGVRSSQAPGTAESPAECNSAIQQNEILRYDRAGTLPEIEDTQLLHRLIARRCICGVDINPLAVELARLSLWIHTFVPGLPLSLRDRNLVVGNALVGIGQLGEIEDEAHKGDPG